MEFKLLGNGVISIGNSDKVISEVSRIEVVIDNAENNSLGVYTDNLTLSLNGNNAFSYNPQSIPTTSKTLRTLVYARDFIGNDKVTSIRASFTRPNTKVNIRSIKIYYK